MKKPKKQRKFLNKPFYPGGTKAINAFITTRLQYPDEAIPHKINGKVEVELTINHKGKVKNVKVIKGLGHGCDEEASRLCMLLKFTVEKNRNMKVTFRRRLNIHFRPPAAAPVQPTMQYSYTITPAPGKEAPKPKSYSYKIDLP